MVRFIFKKSIKNENTPTRINSIDDTSKFHLNLGVIETLFRRIRSLGECDSENNITKTIHKLSFIVNKKTYLLDLILWYNSTTKNFGIVLSNPKVPAYYIYNEESESLEYLLKYLEKDFSSLIVCKVCKKIFCHSAYPLDYIPELNMCTKCSLNCSLQYNLDNECMYCNEKMKNDCFITECGHYVHRHCILLGNLTNCLVCNKDLGETTLL
jgi:hypothetical protein